MAAASIFKPERIDKVLSPEQLDDYVRVAKPGAWLAVGAFLVLAAAVVVWGWVGYIPKTLALNGVLTDDGLLCYVNAEKLEADITGSGVKAVMPDGSRRDGTVISVSAQPYSAAEVRAAQKSDWLAENLITGNYSYAVAVQLDNNAAYPVGTIAAVTIIVAEVKPIQFIFN